MKCPIVGLHKISSIWLKLRLHVYLCAQATSLVIFVNYAKRIIGRMIFIELEDATIGVTLIYHDIQLHK